MSAPPASMRPTSKPQFDATSGATSTPSGASQWAHAPSEPSFGQLAPPSASSTACAGMSTRPCGVSMHRSSRPCASRVSATQRCRMCSRTPRPRSRCSQARSSGAAFRSRGKTRPELPTKVSTPRPAAHSRSAAGGNACSRGSTEARRSPKRVTKRSIGSLCVRFSPPLPASRNLRPTDGMASNKSTCTPARASTSAAIRPAGPPPTIAACIGAVTGAPYGTGHEGAPTGGRAGLAGRVPGRKQQHIEPV